MKVRIETLVTVPAGHEEAWEVEEGCEAVDWNEFLSANASAFLVSDFDEIYDALMGGKAYYAGGGSAPFTRLTRAD